MMGHQPDYQNKLFINNFNLDKRIRKDHILRRIADQIDFDFIYNEVKDTYGTKGPYLVVVGTSLTNMTYASLSEEAFWLLQKVTHPDGSWLQSVKDPVLQQGPSPVEILPLILSDDDSLIATPRH